MLYLWLANLLAVVHGLVVVLVVAGAVAFLLGASRRYRHWQAAYWVVLVLVIAFDVLLGECVLTTWENALRERARPGSGYRDAFIPHYLPFLPRFVLRWGGTIVVVLAILAGLGWRWLPRLRARR